MPERYIYHITPETRWRIARSKGEYSAPSLEEEGFIHCSTMAQVFGVANVFYLDETDEVLLLELDSERIQAEVRYEAPSHPREPNDAGAAENLFPHIYGKLNLDAVTRIYEMRRNDHYQFDQAQLTLYQDETADE